MDPVLSMETPVRGSDFDSSLALRSVQINFHPGPEYASAARKWQGVPGLELSPGGIFWAAWYTGGRTEDENNHVVVVCSTDGGTTWSEPVLVIDPPGDVRACDPVLWHDPLGRLWLFWMQTSHCGVTFDGRGGVWTMLTNDSDNPSAKWTEPRRIANGIMMNKPTVLSTGEWLLPCAVWHHGAPYHHLLPHEHFSNVVVSEDGGETFSLRGSSDVANRSCDEHMFIERRDGSIWMLVRRKDGIGEAVSRDRGVTWQETADVVISSPSARFHLRRLSSGRLLLINHFGFTRRNNLTALLSEDDGKTWPYQLLLDHRDLVTYPDAVEAPDGKIHMIYDHERTGVGEILFQSFTEADVLSGRWISKSDPKPIVVSSLNRQTIGGNLIAFETTELLDQFIGIEKVRDESHPEFEFCMTGKGDCSFALAPVYIDGERMEVYGWVSPGGAVLVELEDATGCPIPGFTKEDCVPSKEVGHSHPIQWKVGGSLRTFAGRLVRIRFYLHDARLHAFLIS